MTKQHLRVFRDLLGSSDMDVRIEAGENLALLHESRIILGLTGGGTGEGDGGSGRVDEEGDEEEGEEDMGDQFDDDGAAEEEAVDLTVLWDEVVEEMKGFITDSSKKVILEGCRRLFLLFWGVGGDGFCCVQLVGAARPVLSCVGHGLYWSCFYVFCFIV